jgi:hypothetical protein
VVPPFVCVTGVAFAVASNVNRSARGAGADGFGGQADKIDAMEVMRMGKFQHDVQGVRAIAVVPVVLFHFGTGVFLGGFVGVDIFYVISGFVIGSRLIQDIGSDRFSIADFYQRRARRILPALLVTCLLTTLAARLSLGPIRCAGGPMEGQFRSRDQSGAGHSGRAGGVHRRAVANVFGQYLYLSVGAACMP